MNSAMYKRQVLDTGGQKYLGHARSLQDQRSNLKGTPTIRIKTLLVILVKAAIIIITNYKPGNGLSLSLDLG